MADILDNGKLLVRNEGEVMLYNGTQFANYFMGQRDAGESLGEVWYVSPQSNVAATFEVEFRSTQTPFDEDDYSDATTRVFARYTTGEPPFEVLAFGQRIDGRS